MRVVKFLKSLASDDADLANAYSNVTKALDRLSSTSTLMTLRNSQVTLRSMEDIQSFLTTNQDKLDEIENQIQEQTLHIDMQFSTVLQRQDTAIEEIRDWKKEQREMWNFMLNGQRAKEKAASGAKQSQNQTKDPAAREAVAMSHVRRWCSDHITNNVSPEALMRKFEANTKETAYSRFFHDDQYSSWVEGHTPLLLVHGAPGLGKSTLAGHIPQNVSMTHAAAGTKGHSVIFHFQEFRAESRSLSNAIYCLITQLASQDSVYCEQIATLIKDSKFRKDDLEITTLWTEFFVKKFGQGTSAVLSIILDGIDELETEHISTLRNLLKQIPQEGLQIRVILLCRSASVHLLDELHPNILEVTRNMLFADIRDFIQKKSNSLSRINKFSPKTKRLFRNKLSKKADGQWPSATIFNPLVLTISV